MGNYTILVLDDDQGARTLLEIMLSRTGFNVKLTNDADEALEFYLAQRFQENQLVELNALKAEAKRQAEEVKYVESLLTEYTRAFRSRMPPLA